MNLDRFFSKLLLLVIPLYFSQGWLFSSGGVISQFLVAIWLVINVYYLIIYILKGQRSVISNIFILFWVANLFYWIISPKVVFGLEGSYATFGDFKNTTIVILSYFPFAYFRRRDIVNENYLKSFFILFLLAAIAVFIVKKDAIYGEFGANQTNNTAYYFAVLLPFLGAFWNKKGFMISFLIIIAFLLFCAKRGAILCGMATYLVYFILSSKDGKSKVIYRLISLIIASIVVYYLYSTSDLLQERFIATLEGDSSDRDIIYAKLWCAFMQGDIVQGIFGHGMSQTVSITGGYAHNDWLELLINEGIFGVVIYASLFISCIVHYWRHMKSMEINYRFIFITSLICLFLRSIFSMGYLAPESALLCIAMACSQERSKQ